MVHGSGEEVSMATSSLHWSNRWRKPKGGLTTAAVSWACHKRRKRRSGNFCATRNKFRAMEESNPKPRPEIRPGRMALRHPAFFLKPRGLIGRVGNLTIRQRDRQPHQHNPVKRFQLLITKNIFCWVFMSCQPKTSKSPVFTMGLSENGQPKDFLRNDRVKVRDCYNRR